MGKRQDYKFLVSVIIPAYNEEKYIGECIDSIKKQKNIKSYEIIVIDDGSTDLTKQIALQKKVIVISLFHGGPGRAKNYGARISSGKILVFIDADMKFDSEYLKNLIKPILNKTCIGTYTTAEYVANKQNIWAKCWNINSNLPLGKRVSCDTNTKGAAFRAILKDKFLSTKGFNPKLGYVDDKSLVNHQYFAMPVNNAKCYHYNPESLKDVFLSARWIGRSMEFNLDIRNLLRYSIINSLKISLIKIRGGAPLLFIIFKIVFDSGIFIGILFKNPIYNFSK